MEEINYPQIRSSEVRWEWIGHAWKLFTSDPGTWILMFLTVFILLTLCNIPIYLMFGLAIFSGRDFDEPSTGADLGGADLGAMSLGLLIPIIFLYIFVTCVFLFLLSGLYRTAIKQARGQSISLADLFSGRDCFLSVVGYQFLLIIISIFLYMVFFLPALIIPGIEGLTLLAASLVYLLFSGLMFYALPLIIDRRAGVLEAMRKSIELTRSNIIMYTIFFVVVMLLSGVGFFACIIGLFVTLPFFITVPAVAYRDVLGLPGAQSYDQFAVPPPPNYSVTAPQEELVSATQPPDQIINPVVCPSCGVTLLRATNFCNQCGSKL
jgi:hypothetical protein